MRVRPIVCKFGGTSLADARRFKQVGEIVRRDGRRRYIVVSAPGKRFGEDVKVTDRLIAAYASEGAERLEALEGAREVFRSIANGLALRSYETELATLDEAAATSRDMSASRGEWLCARVLADFLGLPFVDAAELFVFEDGVLDVEKSYARIRELPPGGAVVPGFYGADASGRVVTFPRGGSDISGAHVAAALNAEIYENWTDVDGFHAADPRLVPDAAAIPFLSYQQARAFSRLGAGVLHHDCIAPVERANVPVVVKNSFRPDAPGTRISKYANWDGPLLAVSRYAAGTCRLTLLGASEGAASSLAGGLPEGSTVSVRDGNLSITCPEASVQDAARIAYTLSRQPTPRG
jgi:aspartate kinase